MWILKLVAICLGLLLLVGARPTWDGIVANYFNRHVSAFAAVGIHARSVLAPERGYVDSVQVRPGSLVSEGATLLTYRHLAEPNLRSIVTSPCACEVAAVRVVVGSEITSVDPVIFLTAHEAVPYVEAMFARDARLRKEDPVEVKVLDPARSIPGKIVQIGKGEEDSGLLGLPPEQRKDARYEYVRIEIDGGYKLAAERTAAVVYALGRREEN